jgi:hypothetical protein
MNLSPFLVLDYVPKLPLTADYGIGLIGAGQIANQAHLPAYRKAGFSVIAITVLLKKRHSASPFHGFARRSKSYSKSAGLTSSILLYRRLPIRS